MILISGKLLPQIKRGITWGTRIHAHPFAWNDSKNGPEIALTKRQQIWSYFNSLLTVTYIFYVIVRGIQVDLDKEASQFKKIVAQFFIVYVTFSLIFVGVMIFQAKSIGIFICQYIGLLQYFEDHLTEDSQEEVGSHEKPKLIQLAELFLDGLFYSINFGPIAFMVAVILKPEAPEFITSLLPIEGQLRSILFVPCILYHAYFMTVFSCNGLFWATILFGFMMPAVTLIRKFGSIPPNEPMTGKMLGQMYSFYRKFQVVLITFNQVVGQLFLPSAKGTIIIFLVYCAFGCVRLHGHLALFMSTTGIATLIPFTLAMIYLAEFNSGSKVILELFRRPEVYEGLGQEGRKCLRSMTVWKAVIGSWYFIDKTVILTVYDIIFDNTVSFLIAKS